MAGPKGDSQVDLDLLLKAQLSGEADMRSFEQRLRNIHKLVQDISKDGAKLKGVKFDEKSIKQLQDLTKVTAMGGQGNKGEVAYINAAMRGLMQDFRSSLEIMHREASKLRADMATASTQIMRNNRIFEGQRGLSRAQIRREQDIGTLRAWSRGAEGQRARAQLLMMDTRADPATRKEAQKTFDKFGKILQTLDTQIKEIQSNPRRQANARAEKYNLDNLVRRLSEATSAKEIGAVKKSAETAQRRLGRMHAKSENDPVLRFALDEMNSFATRAARAYTKAFDSEAKAKEKAATQSKIESRRREHNFEQTRGLNTLTEAKQALAKNTQYLERRKKALATEVHAGNQKNQLIGQINAAERRREKILERINKIQDQNAAVTLRSLKFRNQTTEELKDQVKLAKKIAKELDGRGNTKLADRARGRVRLMEQELSRLKQIAAQTKYIEDLKAKNAANEQHFGNRTRYLLGSNAHDNLQQSNATLKSIRNQIDSLQKMKVQREKLNLLTREERQEIERSTAALERHRRSLSSRVQQLKAQGSQTSADELRRRNVERLTGDGGAALLSIQARLGLNYMILGNLTQGIQEGIRFTIELQKEFKQLQAITRTTDTEMENLEETLIQVSQKTKFTAVQVAQAAVTLGQAGFSTTQISKAMESITLFATATGTDLARSVDIATSVLGVFNKSAEETEMVVNQMTTAINTSKLTTEKMTLGIQYAGNIAHQSGVEFTELVAALGAMANSGIRAGSTLGTGMRQILIALQKPSEEFKSVLGRLGLTMSDVDVRSKGLHNVLMTLKDSGFSAGDAINSFEVRAAAAFNAIQNNLHVMEELELSQLDTAAAFEANETQMESLANQWDRFASIAKTTVAKTLEPTLKAVTNLVKNLADSIEQFNQMEGSAETLEMIGKAITAVVSAGTILLLGKMLKGFLDLFNVTRHLSAGMTVFTTVMAGKVLPGMTATATMMNLVKVSAIGLLRVLGPIGLLATGAWYAFDKLAGSGDDVADSLDRSRAELDRTTAAAEELASSMTVVEREMQKMKDRRASLLGDDAAIRREIEKTEGALRAAGIAFGKSLGHSIDLSIEKLETIQDRLRVMRIEALESARGTIDIHKESIRARQKELQNQGVQLLTDNFTALGTSSQVQKRSRGNITTNQYGAPELAPVTAVSPQLAKELIKGLTSDKNVIQAVTDMFEGKTSDTSVLTPALSRVRAIAGSQYEDNERSIAQHNLFVGLEKILRQLAQADTELKNRNRESDQVTREQAVEQLKGSEFVKSYSRRLEAIANTHVLNQRNIERKGMDKNVDTLKLHKLTQSGGDGIIGKLQWKQDIENIQKEYDELVETYVQDNVNAYLRGLGREAKAPDEAVIDGIAKESRIRIQMALSEQMANTLGKVGDSSKLADEVHKNAKGLFKYSTDKQRSEIKKDLSAYAKAMKTAQTTSRLQAMADHYKDRLTQLKGVEDQVAKFTMKEQDLKVALSKNADEFAAGLRNLEQMQHAGMLAIKGRRFDASMAEYKKYISRLRNENEFEGRRRRAGAQLKQLQNAEKFINSPERAAQYSSVQREQLKEQVRVAKIQKVRMLEAIAEDEVTSLTTVFKTLEEHMQRMQDRYERNRAELETLDPNNDLRANELLQENAKISKFVTDLQTTQQRVGKRLNEQLTTQLGLKEQIAYYDQVVERQGLFEGMVGAIDQTNKGLDVTVTGVEGFRKALRSTQGYLNTFYNDIVDGNKTIGDSFRDLGRNVLEAIQQMITQMLAVKTMQAALGLLPTGGKTFSIFNAGAADGIFGAKVNAGGGLGLAHGGPITGGIPGQDSVHRRLMPGEFVVQKSAVDSVGNDFMHNLNKKGAKALQSGPKNMNIFAGSSNKPAVNVWAVSKDQMPAPGPNDIIATIGDNIARGGVLRKLIKSI